MEEENELEKDLLGEGRQYIVLALKLKGAARV